MRVDCCHTRSVSLLLLQRAFAAMPFFYCQIVRVCTLTSGIPPHHPRSPNNLTLFTLFIRCR